VSHRVIRQALDHFALTRLIDEIVGVPLLGEAAHATDLDPILGMDH
jgi:hypothetical protein